MSSLTGPYSRAGNTASLLLRRKMELNLAGTKGHYTVRDGTEHASKGSIITSYVKLVTFGVGFCLLCVSFTGLGSLTTSFNAELGSFSLTSVYIGFVTSLFVTPSLVDILGAKTCAVGGGFCALAYTVSYFYPTWYTLMPSSLATGVGYGLLYAASGTIKNDEVQRCVEQWKVNPITYQGRFSAIIVSLGLGTAVCLSGLISFSILSFTDVDHSRPNGSCIVSVANTSLTDNTSSMTQYTSPTVYYVLVATMTGVSLLCIFTMSIMRGAAYHQCRVCSFGLKEALRSTATRAVKVLKQAFTPAYGLVLPLRMNQGFLSGYFYGVFTKRYITECVGVEFVGVAVAMRGVSITLGSFGSGWLMRFITSYVMVLVCIGGLEVGSLIFLIAWERQPSFEVIILVSVITGLCYGLNATVGLAYSGTAPGDSVTGYCALVVEHTASQAIQYLVSEYISAEANLYVLLVITILAVPLFTVADIHYGSGTKRNICRRKRLERQERDLVARCEPAAVSSSKESDGLDNGEMVDKHHLAENSPLEEMQMLKTV